METSCPEKQGRPHCVHKIYYKMMDEEGKLVLKVVLE